MIKVNNLNKIYEGHVKVHAIKDVSFEIEQGEFVSIMGPSGSGKSTLLHLLALIDNPTSGTIMLNGTDVGKLSDNKKTYFRLHNLGYVFQEYALIPELNATENTFLPLLLLGTGYKDCAKAAIEMLDKVGLKDRADHLISELSGGEQQRVAIARALTNRSKILFADEPCANLDTNNKGVVLRLLRQLCDELHQTIVMVTHEPEQREYTDRVLWFKDGVLESEEVVNKTDQANIIHNGYRVV